MHSLLAALFFVLLVRPPNAPQYPKEKLDELQAGHMANMKRLGDEKKLVLAGPFLDDGRLRGVFVFDAPGAAEVKQWLSTDPAVAAGRLAGEVHPLQLTQGEIHHVESFTGMQRFSMLLYSGKSFTPPKNAVLAGRLGDGLTGLAIVEDGGTAPGADAHPWMTAKGVLGK